MERPWLRQALRVPAIDGAVYARPEWSEGQAATERNRRLFAENDACLQGRALSLMREWARSEALAAAVKYTAELRGESVSAVENAGSPLIVGGHQPSLFHPGVWIKNFALGELAARTGGQGLHLIVDNDTMGSARLSTPAGAREVPKFETIPFDVDRAPLPWEEARVIDGGLFRTFGDRLTRAMERWGVTPLAARVWPGAVKVAERAGSIRDAFTAVRHATENEWGLSNLELPLSRLCGLDSFLWFTGHILAQLPKFRAIHNEVLREYRQVNRIRSRTHPVADLKQSEEWLEAPFWVWREGENVRGRLMARQSGKELLLSDGHEELARLKLSPEMDACCAVEGLRELAARGVRLRTRALTTTLFARWCLADTFLHGIGGAKYDEMTDRIACRFYEIPAPEFLTISATLRLPIGPAFDVTAEDEERLDSLMRDLRLNPERHLTRGLDDSLDAQLTERDRLVADERLDSETPVIYGTRRQRHRVRAARFHRLKNLKRSLSERTRAQWESAAAERELVSRQRAANRVLQSREYSFLLHPEDRLRQLVSRIGD